MEEKFFERPTQVEFYDEDEQQWMGGIAYKSEIICGCCGGIIPLRRVNPAKIQTLNWQDISVAIRE